METQNRVNRSGRASVPPEPSSTSSERLPAEVREAHQKRIDEYEQRGMENQQPFEAFLATVQADLFRVTCNLGDGVEQALAHGGANVERIRATEPEVQKYLRVSLRMAQYAQLEIRASQLRKQK
jgi:hypothetical protein